MSPSLTSVYAPERLRTVNPVKRAKAGRSPIQCRCVTPAGGCFLEPAQPASTLLTSVVFVGVSELFFRSSGPKRAAVASVTQLDSSPSVLERLQVVLVLSPPGLLTFVFCSRASQNCELLQAANAGHSGIQWRCVTISRAGWSSCNAGLLVLSPPGLLTSVCVHRRLRTVNCVKRVNEDTVPSSAAT